MLLEILVSAILAFVATLVSAQFFIPILVRSNLVEQDINKKSRPILPASGGLILSFGILIGISALVFAVDHIIGFKLSVQDLFAVLIAVIVISAIGFLDDLAGSKIRTSRGNVEKIAKNYTLFNGGIKQWQKPILTLVASIPILILPLGGIQFYVPFIGEISINPLIYSIIIIPLAITFSSNAFNMLEGLNGISVQMSLVAFIAIAIYSYHVGSYTALSLSAIFIAILLGYLYYGKYPAKILPGDSLTYFLGAGFAATIIVGKIQLFGLILIIPWLIEFLLKARAKFHANSWGLLQPDGTLKSPHEKIYSLTHVFMRVGHFKEWQIVLFLTLLEVVFSLIALLSLW